MSTVADDIKTFLALHHRLALLSAAERQQYETLKERVQAALQQPAGER
ncbi:MAG: hypothetical protein Q8N23_13330 [Archangium sp.]|nr:hypothetical protein [Archangium sp.]MDP3153654.1 hypothetical protein [Archangium sp.]MDP3569298.1 hypothetical protein [Archangium sp.]